MNPDSFFNWDMEEEMMDYDFLDSNLDRSSFTEAILHPSLSQIQPLSFSPPRDVSYFDGLGQDKETFRTIKQELVPVKQEPGVVNFVTNLFSDYYAVPSPIPTYTQKRTVTIPPPMSIPFSPQVTNESKHIDIFITEQPPVEVRTRTPGENRTFSLKATVCGPFRPANITAVSAKLLYKDQMQAPDKQTILGGTKSVPVSDTGAVVFDNLCMTEASTKHSEKEFCLEFYFILTDGKEIPSNKTSNSFYAYSHKKVLTRRKNVTLRAISKPYGPVTGHGEYHIVGTPFIKGPSLKCLITTPHGNIEIKYADGNLERYSETVLFFMLPQYPHPNAAAMTEGEAKVVIQVTNDGRHFSNELEFSYLPASHFAAPNVKQEPPAS